MLIIVEFLVEGRYTVIGTLIDHGTRYYDPITESYFVTSLSVACVVNENE